VPIPEVVCLRELEEPEEIAEKNTKISINRQNEENSIRTPMRIGDDMRPCVQAILHSKEPLKGSEGHTMRLAIASEAYNIGLTEDEAIKLFKDQPDFNVQVTRKNIEYVYSKGYNPYSCNKLRNECSSFVRQYCNECSWSND
jgi:DNA primase large subunit